MFKPSKTFWQVLTIFGPFLLATIVMLIEWLGDWKIYFSYPEFLNKTGPFSFFFVCLFSTTIFGLKGLDFSKGERGSSIASIVALAIIQFPLLAIFSMIEAILLGAPK